MSAIGSTAALAAATLIAVALVLLGAVFATLRLVAGPSLADRVVALDYLAVLLALLAALLAVQSGESVLLDVTVVLSLIGFVTTVAFARYAERRHDAGADRGDP